MPSEQSDIPPQPTHSARPLAVRPEPSAPAVVARNGGHLGFLATLLIPTIAFVRRYGWFLGCLTMLIAITVGFEVRFRGTLKPKGALPLKSELTQLGGQDRRKLVFQEGGKRYSYQLEGNPIQLEDEMVDKLGTKHYISWVLRLRDDTEGRPTDQTFQLFVTYYTGNPDQVPHVPEECYLGNGFEQVGNSLEPLELPPSLPAKDRQVPLQTLLFRRDADRFGGGEQCEMVMYTFRVCDEWLAERERVRFTLGNPLARYAYFSKVELSFPLPAGMPPQAVEKAKAEGKRFLNVVLPLLVQDHWPVWPTDDGQTRPGLENSKVGTPEAAPRS